MSHLMFSHCLRCEDAITLAQFFVEPQERIQPALARNVLFRLKSGVLLVVVGERATVCYCAECAPEVWYCVICGCTDEIGCEEGCSWRPNKPGVTGHLCTSCSPCEAVTVVPTAADVNRSEMLAMIGIGADGRI